VSRSAISDRGKIADGITPEQMAVDLGITLKDLAKMMNTTVDELDETFKNYNKATQEAYDKIFTGTDALGLGDMLKPVIEDLNN
jgi:hypothetical protein